MVHKRRSWRAINQLLFDTTVTGRADAAYYLVRVAIIWLSLSNWNPLEQRRPFVAALCHSVAHVTAPVVLLVHHQHRKI